MAKKKVIFYNYKKIFNSNLKKIFKALTQYFIFEMNKLARSFNLKYTNFANPHGLVNSLN